MAIFEKKFERKITLDDTQSLSCVIETAQEVDGHTVSASIERKKKIYFFCKKYDCSGIHPKWFTQMEFFLLWLGCVAI